MEERNVKAKAVRHNQKLVNSDIVKISNLELNCWLAKFFVQIRKKGDKGEHYPPVTLHQLCCGLSDLCSNIRDPVLKTK